MRKFIILFLLTSFCTSSEESKNIRITTTTNFQEVTTTFVTTTTLSILDEEKNANFELTGLYETNEEREVREQNNPWICSDWFKASAYLSWDADSIISRADDIRFSGYRNIQTGRSVSSDINKLLTIINNFDTKKIELLNIVPNIENTESHKYLIESYKSLENALFTLLLSLQNEDLEVMKNYEKYKNELELNIFKYERERKDCQFAETKVVKPNVDVECPREITTVTQDIKFNIFSGSGKIVNVSIYLDINNGDEIINTYFDRDSNSDIFSFADEDETNEYSYLIDSSTYNSETFYIFNVSVVSEQSNGDLYDDRDFCYITYKP